MTGFSVMPGLVPAIHVFLRGRSEGSQTWMPGTGPGMTKRRGRGRQDERCALPPPVMAGLVPAIQVFLRGRSEGSQTWMPGTGPGMTDWRGRA